MRVLITGACGFVGASLARALKADHGLDVSGIDNFSRPGSEVNRVALRAKGIDVRHGDVRCPSDLVDLGKLDAVVDAAADPAVGSGLASGTSRRTVEQNLGGTVNILELCKDRAIPFILLSTSRVYSLRVLGSLPLEVRAGAFGLKENRPEIGVMQNGISESCSTDGPRSLYGGTKLASEVLAQEYAEAFGIPIWINRCGVLAGAGQFGRPDQGVVSFWINAYIRGIPLRFIGYGGRGHQVRDCLHPGDLAVLVHKQLMTPSRPAPRTVNVSGGLRSARSLFQLTNWCRERFGDRPVGAVAEAGRFDAPWIVLDSAAAEAAWDWRPSIEVEAIWSGIAAHAQENPDWLVRSQGIPESRG